MPLATASIKRSDFTGTFEDWNLVKASATFSIGKGSKEILYGEGVEIEDAVAFAADKKPYGNVPYADPGYQKDGKKRYPIDTEEHVRAAHNYFSKPANNEKYTPEQRAKIKARIHSAWVRLVDSKGPPSDEKKS